MSFTLPSLSQRAPPQRRSQTRSFSPTPLTSSYLQLLWSPQDRRFCTPSITAAQAEFLLALSPHRQPGRRASFYSPHLQHRLPFSTKESSSASSPCGSRFVSPRSSAQRSQKAPNWWKKNLCRSTNERVIIQQTKIIYHNGEYQHLRKYALMVTAPRCINHASRSPRADALPRVTCTPSRSCT